MVVIDKPTENADFSVSVPPENGVVQQIASEGWKRVKVTCPHCGKLGKTKIKESPNTRVQEGYWAPLGKTPVVISGIAFSIFCLFVGWAYEVFAPAVIFVLTFAITFYCGIFIHTTKLRYYSDKLHTCKNCDKELGVNDGYERMQKDGYLTGILTEDK